MNVSSENLERLRQYTGDPIAEIDQLKAEVAELKAMHDGVKGALQASVDDYNALRELAGELMPHAIFPPATRKRILARAKALGVPCR
jgi:hypothetical protein